MMLDVMDALCVRKLKAKEKAGSSASGPRNDIVCGRGAAADRETGAYER